MGDPAISPESARLPNTADADSPLRVVVGWDMAGSEAVDFASWLGRSLPVCVKVVSSARLPRIQALTSSAKSRKKRLKEIDTAFRKRVTKELDGQLPRGQWADAVTELVDSKDTLQALYGTASDFGADLIVMGSRAKTPKGRFRPSSIADEMLYSSPVPLGLAPRGVKLSKKGLTRVTYAIVQTDDPAEPNFSGLDYATALACTLELPLRIIAFSPTRYDDHEPHWYEETLGMLDHARDRAWAYATEISPVRIEHFDVTSSISTGKSWKRSIDSVKWKKGDLMCLGSQPAPQLRSVFVGTREGEFIRYATVPVIICPEADK